MDWLGLAGLVAAIAALIVAVYGINDVRKQVRMLITLERNRAWVRLLHGLVWKRFVEPTEETANLVSAGEMHEFIMLVRTLDHTHSTDSAQEYANNEMLAYANEMVERGLAKWREDLDVNRLREALKAWQKEKNTAALYGMFGRSHTSLSGPPKKMVDD